MKKPILPSMHLEVDKANSAITTTIIVASVVSIFCLVSSQVLFSQLGYQRRLLHARRQTIAQLKLNQTAATTLTDQYSSVFEGTSATNIIGGKNDSSANALPPNGDNASIVLDSLPTTYDYPALISSLTKILSDNAIANPAITGSDQSATASNSSSASPQPIPIKLSVGGQASYTSVQNLIANLERSTRPFDVTDIQLSGTDSLMTFDLNVTTYYQNAKTITIDSQGKYVQ